MLKKSNAVIEVPEGFETHKGIARRIVLRYPTVEDYLELGEINNSIPTNDGRSINRLDKDVIKSYIERLMVEPPDQIPVSNLPMDVGRELVVAVIGFFHPSSQAAEPSKTSGENSSTEQTASTAPNTSTE